MKSADFPWWIGGGWALDLFLGAETRSHEDIDVVVLRHHQHKVQRLLIAAGWEIFAGDPSGSLREWKSGEFLEKPVHQIWCRPLGAQDWALELMLHDVEGSEWIYRRNPLVRRPFNDTVFFTDAGVPVLRPEVQLLYKSKTIRPKDEEDFRRVLPRLDPRAQRWLRESLKVCNSAPHPWIEALSLRPARL
jgi:hypothetical protein